MLFDDPRLRFADHYAPAIRTAYWERVNRNEARLLEPLVRSLARDARRVGLPAERAIVALKLSIHGELRYPLAELATVDDQRKYELFERLIGWVLDEYFDHPEVCEDDEERLAS